MVLITVGNSRSRVQGLGVDLFRLMRYELSYRDGEPGQRRHLNAKGAVEVVYWDGWRTLLDFGGEFPSGLVPRMIRMLRKWQVPYDLRDARHKPSDPLPRWAKPESKLRDYQDTACLQALQVGRGVIDSPPRSGKTVMIEHLVHAVGGAGKVVIISPTDAIARQTYERLVKAFADREWSGTIRDCSTDFYALIGGLPKTLKEKSAFAKATVFVGTAATAVLLDKKWWLDVITLITDEHHHQAADTYQKINDRAVNAYYRWGFTGTNFRSQTKENLLLEAALGRTIASYSIKQMIDRGVIAPMKVDFWPMPDVFGCKSFSGRDAYDRGIVNCEIRNRYVAYAATKLVEVGRKVLVLVNRIEHGKSLAGRIEGARFVQGGDGGEVGKAVADLHSGKIKCLVGSPVVGEGLDCPAADALVYAKGYQARVTHTQDALRVSTKSAGKTAALVVDFVDRHNPTLLDHSVGRMRNYTAMHAEITIRDRSPVDVESLPGY